MPATKSLLNATQDANTSVFNAFNTYCSAPRTETKTTVLDLLRDRYPEYHVTEVESGQVSLFEFADADKATVVFDSEDESFMATRKWHAVGEGVQKKLHPGRLDDEFWFARFQYIWEGKEFLVYYVTWEDMFKNPKKQFYILYPRTETNIFEGHCTETDALIIAAGKWTSQPHEEIFVFDDGCWEKSKELWKSVNGSSWDDVILDPEMKKNLIEDVQGFFGNQALYSQFAVPWKRGIILHGVPGNGKTVSIKALMNSLDQRDDQIPSLYVKSFENSCQTEQYAIRQIFIRARKCAPCLLIFEDLDSLVNDDIRSYFLNEVDGLESNDGILMIGSTNHLDKLDPAISKRPSRFDRKYHFKLPSEDERKLYAEYWRKKLLKNETVEFPEDLCQIVAQLTEGFSFAYLKELFIMALLSLVRGFKGDDFEIVDTADAESATADESTDAKTTDDEKKQEESVCTCAKTCTTCNKPFPKDSPTQPNPDGTQALSEAAGASQDSPKKMVMPSVDIPEHLAENLLLKVVKHQIRILHSEMDNTKEEQWPSGKKAIGGNMGRVPGRAMMMRMMRGRF